MWDGCIGQCTGYCFHQTQIAVTYTWRKEWDVAVECLIENREHTIVEVAFAVQGTGSCAPIGSESRKKMGGRL